MFGGVPINVIAPPSSAPNERGINSLDGLILALVARLIIAGSKTATVPVSLIKPDKSATAAMMTKIKRTSLSPAIDRMRRPIDPANPVCMTAPPTINNEAIVRTAVLEKPEIASEVVNTPDNIRAITTPKATTSTRSHSVTKSTMAANKIPNTIHISKVIKKPPKQIFVCFHRHAIEPYRPLHVINVMSFK